MRDRCTMLWKKIQYRVPYDMSDRRWLIAMYTMSFSILAFFVFGIFSYYGKTLIGGTDGMSQVAAFMQYNGKITDSFLQEFCREILRFQCGICL